MREQRSKGREYNRVQRVQDLRRGSRTDRHRDRSKYHREDFRRVLRREQQEES